MSTSPPLFLFALLASAILVLLEALGVPAARALATHWPLFAPALVIALGMAGLIGKGFGLQNLFHDDAELAALYRAQHGWTIWLNSPALCAQATVTGSLVYVWGFAHALGIEGAEVGRLADASGTVMAAVVGCLTLNLACGTLRLSGSVGRTGAGEGLRAGIGALIGLIYAWLALRLAIWLAPAIGGLGVAPAATQTLALGVPAAGTTLFLLWYRKLLPAVALAALAMMLNTLYAGMSLLPEAAQPLVLLAGTIWLALANGGLDRLRGREARLKFRIPGIIDGTGRSRYRADRRLALARLYPAMDEAGDFREKIRRRAPLKQVDPRRAHEATAGRIAPVAALEAWRGRRSQRPLSLPRAGISEAALAPLVREAFRRVHDGPERRSRKPKLVLIATSGGAYRASFWSGIVLDALAELDRAGVLPGFCGDVRVITGASGGMVAGAYFAALAGEDGMPQRDICAALEADILAVQAGERGEFPHPTRFPIPRDSLSPVVQRLIQRDLPGLLWPAAHRHDRGTVLEDQWATLDRSFAALRDGEREGWRPSLILSPMLAETGQPLLISNLDMDLVRRDAYGETVQFFDWFPEAQDTFRVKTAVRLNAAFPYIAPAAALPTTPARRVVDAGYYDNYGVDLAATYLARPEIRDWILANTSGVILLQLRAFPFALPLEDGTGLVGRALRFVTTPAKAALAARGATMTFRNRQSLRQVRLDYRDRAFPDIPAATRPDFVESVSFEVDSDTSMSWYLPGHELAGMREAFRDETRQAALARLVEAWWR